MDKASLPYRKGVGIILINKDKQIFVGKRIDTRVGGWQMPQGGIDDGEDPEQAVLRELEEEVGTNKVEIIASSKDWFHYDLPDDLIGKMWSGKYRGQQQKWFVLKFLGDDKDINLSTEIPEFENFKWVMPDELVDMIVSFKKELYKNITKEFKNYLF